jgi:hypothetical protein
MHFGSCCQRILGLANQFAAIPLFVLHFGLRQFGRFLHLLFIMANGFRHFCGLNIGRDTRPLVTAPSLRHEADTASVVIIENPLPSYSNLPSNCGAGPRLSQVSNFAGSF